ncbi:hypothetical protein L596_004781 [Steinernema carpocapsae]|uniref:VWFA domain-containing protein n=1 Tax=Steinernema carpocapsae TaxID=34508 RepID=A0A4U8UWV1_STECR|nr:hypothetical protein L596_004781 [Steinernema carpocapsae]
MWSIHFLVLLLANVGLIASQKYCHVQGKPQRSNNTFECECDWEGIWLDIVLLLPQASGTELDLSNIKASVDTLLGFMNISESDRNSHFSVIGYAAKPTVLTGLNANQSRSTLIDIVNGMEYSGVGEVNIARALGGAAEELRKSKRRSARKVIVIFGSVLSPIDDPLETATQLHEDGISIVTVVYEQSDETSLSLRLGELASPGMNFSEQYRKLV